MNDQRIYLPADDFHKLFVLFGPSLGLWRAAEIAVLRRQEIPAPVLDLGCGDGLVTSFILPQVELGVDPDLNALKRANSLRIYRQIRAVAMEDSQLSSNSYATVLSNSVLEHIEKIDPVLETAARVLMPGGKMLFTVPSESFSASLLLPGRRYPAWRNRHYQHLNLWTVEKWQSALSRVGLRVQRVESYLRPGWVRVWDLLELLQHIKIADVRLFGWLWRNIPFPVIDRLAVWASRIDLSASIPGGGRLVAAVKE